jgi:tetratricopeptide (TPR) repeat protein
MVKKITILLLMLVCTKVHAENSIMLEQANQLYQNKQYDSASSLYMQMIDEGYYSDIIYYNAGNSFYKQNKIGKAIWCYKHAIEINKNKSVTDNLQLAKNKISNLIPAKKDIFFIRWWKNLQRYFTINQWSMFALVSFTLAFLIQVFRILKSKNTLTRLCRNMLYFISFISLIMMFLIQYNSTNNYTAIVIKDTPFYNEKDWFKKDRIVTDGNEVYVLNATETYKRANIIKVRLANGKVGFLAKNDLIK